MTELAHRNNDGVDVSLYWDPAPRIFSSTSRIAAPATGSRSPLLASVRSTSSTTRTRMRLTASRAAKRPSLPIYRKRRSPTTPLGKSTHLAARMGRWSASHWKTATFGWIAFVVAAFVIGQQIGTKHLDPNKTGSGESGHVEAVLADQYKQSQVEDVLVQSSSDTVSSPAFRQAIVDVTARLRAQKAVYDVASPLAAGNQGQISNDRHSALVQFKLAGTDLARADKEVVPVEHAVSELQRTHPQLFIGEFGDASADRALNARSERTSRRPARSRCR